MHHLLSRSADVESGTMLGLTRSSTTFLTGTSTNWLASTLAMLLSTREICGSILARRNLAMMIVFLLAWLLLFDGEASRLIFQDWLRCVNRRSRARRRDRK